MAIPNKRTSADFTFKHSGQVDEYGASIGDATVIQANFDQRAIDNMTAINNLIDSLIDTTEGSTGADSISSTPLSTGVYSNIQANLEFLQQAINDVVLGQIPDGSLTYEKLSPSLVENLATVENLKTLTKNGIITDELNEMAISANDPNDRSINIDTGKLLLNGSVYTYDTLMNVSIDAPEVENVPSEPHTLGATGNLTLDHTPIGKSDASALAEVGDIVVTDVGTGNPINVTSIDPSTGEVVTEGSDGTTVSVSYYPFTKRIDVVYADITDGTINVEKGTGEISGTDPTKPTPADALELCEIDLDFNYTVISDTEITSSMLYGGFRGLGQVPLNAWNYIMFKNELTQAEIDDIEANSSLMNIINNTSDVPPIYETLQTTNFNESNVSIINNNTEVSDGNIQLSGTNLTGNAYISFTDDIEDNHEWNIATCQKDEDGESITANIIEIAKEEEKTYSTADEGSYDTADWGVIIKPLINLKKIVLSQAPGNSYPCYNVKVYDSNFNFLFQTPSINDYATAIYDFQAGQEYYFNWSRNGDNFDQKEHVATLPLTYESFEIVAGSVGSSQTTSRFYQTDLIKTYSEVSSKEIERNTFIRNINTNNNVLFNIIFNRGTDTNNPVFKYLGLRYER